MSVDGPDVAVGVHANLGFGKSFAVFYDGTYVTDDAICRSTHSISFYQMRHIGSIQSNG